MEDSRIIELYWSRLESAISETAAKYGGYCHSIAYNILRNREDAEECVNDTYIGAWNAMPPHRPSVLSAFLGKITRRISIDCWRARTSEKRGGGETALALEELADCIPAAQDVERELARGELAETVNAFLDGLPADERRAFLCRYWYLDSVQEISDRFGFSRSKTASMLHRTRLKLRRRLEQEDYHEI